MVIYRPSRLNYTDLSVTLQSISGVTGQVRRFLFNGSQYVLAEFNSVTRQMELNYWDTDGSAGTSRIMSKTNILDVVYDKTDQRYYAVRWNQDSGFTGTPSSAWSPGTIFLDEFTVGKSTDTWKFREDLWIESAPSWAAYSYNTSNYTGAISTADARSWTLFMRNPSTERAEFKTTAGRGTLRTALSTADDFQAYATFRMTTYSGSSSIFSMRLVDMDNTFDGSSYSRNNLMSQSSFWGNYSGNSTGRWQAAHMYLSSDSTGGDWAVRNFRLLEPYIDSAKGGLTTYSGSSNYSEYLVSFYDIRYVGGEYKHYFKVNQTSPGTTVLASGIISQTSSSFELVDSPFAFTLMANPSINLNSKSLLGSSIKFNVRVSAALEGGSTLATASGVSGFRVGVGKAGTNLYARRDDDDALPGYGWQNIGIYNALPVLSSRQYAVELGADCVSAAVSPDLTIDDFRIESASSTVVWADVPTLTVETYNSAGTIQTLGGVSDSEGYIIRRLNAINYSTSAGGSFTDILNNGIVAIATDHISAASGGSIFILVRRSASDSTKIYRFKKNVFPLTSVENGTNAEFVKTGTLDYPSQYRLGSFSYSNYSEGQLSYTARNWADPGRGFFVCTLLSGTLSGTLPRRTAWLQDVDYTAWNINDWDSYYGVTVTGTNAGKVRLFNMTPDTAAFCNVVSRNRMLDAGTGATSTVLAQVMNPYGAPLSGKTVSFSVSAGDGAIAPATALTNVSGEASAVYTVGTAVTTSTITATVNI